MGSSSPPFTGCVQPAACRDWAMQEDEELLVVGCADGQEWPMQEVQAPSWEVQVSICI